MNFYVKIDAPDFNRPFKLRKGTISGILILLCTDRFQVIVDKYDYSCMLYNPRIYRLSFVIPFALSVVFLAFR